MNSIKKNVAYQTIYEILIIILPFFTSPYISRLFGPELLGIYSYTYSTACYFQMFCMLGIKFYGNRCIAKVRDDKEKVNKTYSELLEVHLLFSILSFVAYIIYSLFWAENREYALLQSFMVLASVLDVSWLFFGLEQFKTTVMRSIIVKVASVLAIFALVKSSSDFSLYIVIIGISQLVNSLILLLMTRKYVVFRIVKSPKELIPHIKPLFVLFIPILALSLFKYMDKIMLGSLGDKVELGYYENAEKVLNIPLSVIFSFGSVMLPRMTNVIAREGHDATDYYMQKSIKFMVGISYAMVAGIAGIAGIFAPLFWGNEFYKSGELIAILSISIPFSTLASIIRNQDLIPKEKDKYYNISIISGAIVNFVINYMLIPKYQAYGVAIGTIIAEIVVCMIELWFVRSNVSYFRYLKNSLLFLPSSIVMYFIVRKMGQLLGQHVYTLFIQVLFGISFFAICIFFILRLMHDEDFAVIDRYISINKLRKRKKQ